MNAERQVIISLIWNVYNFEFSVMLVVILAHVIKGGSVRSQISPYMVTK